MQVDALKTELMSVTISEHEVERIAKKFFLNKMKLPKSPRLHEDGDLYNFNGRTCGPNSDEDHDFVRKATDDDRENLSILAKVFEEL